ncbi:hypothetical protein IQ07DRAFT_592180 [Pyrenochaeta sp. DS3sAY3a]|nr:hypothetical protein IQ07DRAFT_592180 [Pyrenochaeta sp. DS3sAY3a]
MHFSPSSITLLFAFTVHSLPPANAIPSCSPLVSSILNPVAWALYKQFYCDIASPPTSEGSGGVRFGEDGGLGGDSVVDSVLLGKVGQTIDKPVIVVVGHGRPPPPVGHKPEKPLPKRPKPPKRKVGRTV